MLAWLTGGTATGTVRTQCVDCGKTAAKAGLRKQTSGWLLVYEGIVSGTGSDGSPVARARARSIKDAFKRPYRAGKFVAAELADSGGFCVKCRKVYCWIHWNHPTGGIGRCPKGHFQSLDPHWSAEWSDDA